MTKSQIAEIKDHLKLGDNFVVITGSQYSIVSNKRNPILFDDEDQYVIQLVLSNRNHMEQNVDFYRIPYDQIEEIVIVTSQDDAINLLKRLMPSVTAEQLRAVSKSINVDLGKFINENENVKGSRIDNHSKVNRED